MTMDFHDDPRPLLTELDKAWAQYTRDFDALMKQYCRRSFPGGGLPTTCSLRIRSSVRRIPRHKQNPGDHLTGIGCEMTIQRQTWATAGNMALIRRAVLCSREINTGDKPLSGETAVAIDCRFTSQRKKQVDSFGGLPYDDSVGFSRFWHNKDGRIECMCSYLREDDVHYRTFEWFDFEGKRCVESIQQSFEIMPEIPHYQQDKSEDELRADYRPLQGGELINNLVETMFSRRRIKYSYSPTGELLKAEEFRANGEPLDELLFEKLPERSLEETIDALVDKTAEAIEKAVKKRSTAKPYRGLILIYSAEHAHCGLPHQVSVLGHETPWPKDRFYHEDYPVQLEVAFKRPVWSLLTEFNQRCHARFAMDEFDAQTATAVAVMQKITEQLHRALAGTKHVTDDFAVLAIDDHGDVDNFAVPA